MALANYYILRGVIYQAPDLHHVLNSRLTTSLHHLQQALDTTLDMSRFVLLHFQLKVECSSAIIYTLCPHQVSPQQRALVDL